MKVIIDIPETEFNHIKKVWSKRRGSIPYTNIAFGTPIPDNATNGDVFMSTFPELKVEDNIGSIYMHDDNGIALIIDKKWLNSPYKKEVEE